MHPHHFIHGTTVCFFNCCLRVTYRNVLEHLFHHCQILQQFSFRWLDNSTYCQHLSSMITYIIFWSLADFLPLANSLVSHNSFQPGRVKGLRRFLWDMWSQPTTSFRAAAHDTSQDSWTHNKDMAAHLYFSIVQYYLMDCIHALKDIML